MKPYRMERLEKELLRIVNNALIYKTNDPRLQSVSATEAALTPDMQYAKIYFSVFQDDIDINELTLLLTKASGFIKKEIAAAKLLRRIPEIRFVYDDTNNRVSEVESILKDINNKQDS